MERMDKPKAAESILNHPLVREFLDQLHAQVYSGLKKAKTDQSREELAAYGRYADEFEQFLRHYMQTGEMEKIQEREKQRLADHEAEWMQKVRAKYVA